MATVGNDLKLGYKSAIEDPLQILTYIKAYEDNVTPYVADTGTNLYVYKAIQGDDKAPNTWSWSFGVGPLSIQLEINTATYAVSVKVYLSIPIVGSVLIGQATGNLKDGVTVTVGYSGIISGTITLTVDLTNKHFTIAWNFEAFSIKYAGSQNIAFPWSTTTTNAARASTATKAAPASTMLLQQQGDQRNYKQYSTRY